jgi:hypothetical protein
VWQIAPPESPTEEHVSPAQQLVLSSHASLGPLQVGAVVPQVPQAASPDVHSAPFASKHRRLSAVEQSPVSKQA